MSRKLIRAEMKATTVTTISMLVKRKDSEVRLLGVETWLHYLLIL